MSGEDDGFLQRWARRKTRAQGGLPEPEQAPVRDAPPQADPPVGAAPAALAQPPASMPAPAPVEEPVPRPTMDDVARLTRSSDYSRFVGVGVDADVSNAAMRKLFSDPAFNVMDGLDTYIDDYGKPDPIPESMLRQMVQARFLGLFDAEDDPVGEARPGVAAPVVATASTDGAALPAVAKSMHPEDPIPIASVSPPGPDDDPDLRLQQDDAPGRAGLAPGPRA